MIANGLQHHRLGSGEPCAAFQPSRMQVHRSNDSPQAAENLMPAFPSSVAALLESFRGQNFSIRNKSLDRDDVDGSPLATPCEWAEPLLQMP